MSRSRNIFALPEKAELSQAELAELKPRTLSAWSEALPASEARANAQALFERARHLACCELSPNALFDSLEALVGLCPGIVMRLEDRLAGKSLPLEKKDLRVSDLLYKLRLKVYLGYKRVLDESGSQRGARRLLHRSLRRRALHRAQEILFELLRNRYQVYRAVPYHHWREIHRNFEIAHAEGRAEWAQPLLTDSQVSLSIEGLYKQALLFALAGPQRFLPRDIQRLRLALRRWVDASRLERIGTELEQERAPFIIDISEDRPPVHIAAAEMSHEVQGWYLHTTELVTRVAVELGVAERRRAGNMRDRPISRPDRLSSAMLSSLLLSWGMGARRHVARDHRREPARVALGFDDLYALLGGTPMPDSSPERDLSMSAANRPAWSLQAAELSWNSELVEFDVVEGGDENEADKVRIHSFLMCDVGSGGMSLCVEDASLSPAHVGELVGVLSDPGSRSSLRVGVVRWMRLDKHNRQQCGVEFLFEDPQCSILRIVRKNGAVEYMPVIYQPAGGRDEHMLLATKCVYADSSDRFCWCFHGEARPLLLSQMLECSGGFSLFQVPASTQGDRALNSPQQVAACIPPANVTVIGCAGQSPLQGG